MGLRSRLILAFLVLAVLPLTGITLHSYVTTERAYRQAVEAEANDLSEQMSARLDSVTKELGQRLEGLGELPLWTTRGSSPDPEVEQVLAELPQRIGDAAALVESLEFTPTAPPQGTAPAPPAGEGPGPSPQPVPETPPEGQPLIVLAPEGPQPGETPAPPTERRWRYGDHPAVPPSVDPQAADRQVREAEKAVEEMVAAAMNNSQDALRQAEEARRRAGRELEEARRAMSKRADAATRSGRHQRFRFDRGLDVLLSKQGTPIGTVRARIRSRTVLASLLPHARRRQGEIPFAIDSDGKLHASDAELARLTSLGLPGALALGPRLGADWIVSAKRDPETGLTLGLVRPIGQGLREIRRTSMRNLTYGLGLVVVALVGILPLSRRMTRNLSALTDGAERLAHGDLDTRVSVTSSDEFGRLAGAFNRMAHDLKQHQEQLLQQERMRKELEMGRRIQEEMLPHDRLCFPFAEVKGVSIPAREVGGDLFNYFPLTEGEAALVVGDVSGKGVAAALLMANVQATLRARVPLERDLSTLCGHLDREIDATTPSTVYLTCFLGILDGARRRLRYVNAGHNAPFVLRANGGIEALEPTGRPFGLLPGGSYEERTVQFESGDWLFLYTDGVVESENEAGEAFGAERLQGVLLRERASSVDAILAAVEEEVRTHRGTMEASDDATLVVLRVGSPRA